jgi:hypothetical protein
LTSGKLVFGTKNEAGQSARPFRFLSVFKWEARKGWPILLKGFVEEFKVGTWRWSNEMDVQTVIKSTLQHVKMPFQTI